MKQKREGSQATPNDLTATEKRTSTNVAYVKDIEKVLDFFRYTTGTTLDCSIYINISRHSITWYVYMLTKLNLLFVVKRDKDKTTGRVSNYYSTERINIPSNEDLPADCKHISSVVKDVVKEVKRKMIEGRYRNV